MTKLSEAIEPASALMDVSTSSAKPAAEPERRSSLERLHRLLSSFDYEHTRLTLTELSRRSGIPLSTTHRMVTELLELGMLERDRDQYLCIGVSVWKFGLLTPKTFGIQRVALPFMQDLYATTGLPIHLGVRQGYEVTMVESLRPRSSGKERPRVGQRDPMHIIAVGMAILAYSDSEFQEGYLAELERRHSTGDNAAAVIRRELAATRAEGYAVSSRKTAPALAIGAPVLDQASQPLGAISIIVPGGSAVTPYGHLIRSTARAAQRTAMEQGVA